MRGVWQQELALEWDPALRAGRHAAGGWGHEPLLPLEEPELGDWAERTRALAAAVDGRVRALGPVQALLVRCLRTTLSAEAEAEGDRETREELFVRVETPWGGLLESWGAPGPHRPSPAEVAELLAGRLEPAAAVLGRTAGPLDPSLPLCLAPSAAAPLVAALGMLLRGDIAAATGLGRNLGKRVLAAAVSVGDLPSHPGGTRQRRVDDEGQPCVPLTLVEAGRLVGFVHSRQTAATLQQPVSGRGFLREGGEAGPAALNLALQPGVVPLPADHAWLGCRIETFTPSPALGVVSLRLAGREIHDGKPGAAIAPFDVELPVLEVLRRVLGTGPRVEFFPAFDGVGTPWLLLEPGALQPRLKR